MVLRATEIQRGLGNGIEQTEMTCLHIIVNEMG